MDSLSTDSSSLFRMSVLVYDIKNSRHFQVNGACMTAFDATDFDISIIESLFVPVAGRRVYNVYTVEVRQLSTLGLVAIYVLRAPMSTFSYSAIYQWLENRPAHIVSYARGDRPVAISPLGGAYWAAKDTQHHRDSVSNGSPTPRVRSFHITR
jgi:hypothetical protein